MKPEGSSDLLGIGRRWQCSAPEYLQESAPMRFCGFELTKVEQGIRLDQFGYTQELLKKYRVEGAESCPLPKVPDEETTEETFTAEDLEHLDQLFDGDVQTKCQCQYLDPALLSAIVLQKHFQQYFLL